MRSILPRRPSAPAGNTREEMCSQCDARHEKHLRRNVGRNSVLACIYQTFRVVRWILHGSTFTICLCIPNPSFHWGSFLSCLVAARPSAQVLLDSELLLVVSRDGDHSRVPPCLVLPAQTHGLAMDEGLPGCGLHWRLCERRRDLGVL